MHDCALAKSFFLFGNQSFVPVATPICMAVTLVEAEVLLLLEAAAMVHRDAVNFVAKDGDVAEDGDVVEASHPTTGVSNSRG